jgi:hypothetical protein
MGNSRTIARKWKVKDVRESLTRLRFLTDEEEVHLLEVLAEPQRAIVLRGLYMSLRVGAEVTQHSVRRNETLPIAFESETCTPVTFVTREGTEEA